MVTLNLVLLGIPLEISAEIPYKNSSSNFVEQFQQKLKAKSQEKSKTEPYEIFLTKPQSQFKNKSFKNFWNPWRIYIVSYRNIENKNNRRNNEEILAGIPVKFFKTQNKIFLTEFLKKKSLCIHEFVAESLKVFLKNFSVEFL